MLDSAHRVQDLSHCRSLGVEAHVMKPVWRIDLEKAMLTTFAGTNRDTRRRIPLALSREAKASGPYGYFSPKTISSIKNSPRVCSKNKDTTSPLLITVSKR